MKRFPPPLFILFLLLASPVATRAFSLEAAQNLDLVTVQRGYTVLSPDADFAVGVLPGTLQEATRVRLRRDTHEYATPTGLERVTPIWEYDVAMAQPRILERPLVARFGLSEVPSGRIFVAFFNRTSGRWQFVPGKYDAARRQVSAFLHFPYAQVAVFTWEAGAKSQLEDVGDLQSGSVALIDAASGQLLFGKNENQARPLASLTKLATAKVFLTGDPDWDATISLRLDDQVGGAQLFAKVGETLTARDAFYTTLVGSANNTARLLFRLSGKNQTDFVAAMNAYADRLNLPATHFVEPTGLDENNQSTALEYALLARDAFADPRVFAAVTAPHYSFIMQGTGTPHLIKSTDRLINSDLFITGAKTGYTDEAGYTFALRAKDRRSGAEVVAVVLGAPTSDIRFDESYRLAKAGLQLLRNDLVRLNSL